MKHVKITLADGDTFNTSINGSDEMIYDYYKIGSVVNMGTENDRLVKIVKCEILGEIAPQYIGQDIEVEMYDYKLKKSVWERATFTGSVSALDRPYRVNVRLNDGTELKECAPECIRSL